MLTAFPPEASSNLSGRLPLHVAFFVSGPGTFFDAAEAGVVSRACVAVPSLDAAPRRFSRP